MASSFAQIVWKDTAQFGIAKVNSERKGLPQVFVAAIYQSPGNVKGFYHENISKGRFKKSYCKKVHSRNNINQDTQVLTTFALKEKLNRKDNDKVPLAGE